MRIVLIGCRGAGKSVVGKIVARRLHLKFLDTDKIVEKTVGKTISEIFRLHGEQYFRAAESKIIRSIRDKSDVVIAAGGGALTRKSNITNLRSGEATIFYLSAPSETLYRRCQSDSGTVNQRPLLTPVGGLAEMRKILRTRECVYRTVADITVDTSSSGSFQVAGEIIKIAKKKASPPRL